MLDVAIVPPHPTVLSMRMAMALYVTGISTPEAHPEFPPLLGDVDDRSRILIDVRWARIINPRRPGVHV